MSRLNDLLRQLRIKDPALAADLQREVDAFSDRRAFGLNFERHVPEAVELPGRPVRRGDKVRVRAALSQVINTLKVLDLQIPEVRDAILAPKLPPIDLYLSPVAIVYNPA